MSDPFEKFIPNPFERENPFMLLGASPNDSVKELTEKASYKWKRAPAQKEERAIRGALRELTKAPLDRAVWEIFTPHTDKSFHPCNAGNASAWEILGEFLFCGTTASDSTTVLLHLFADSLDGISLLIQQKEGAGTGPDVERWWEGVTHRNAGRWEYWHQLALLFHCHAANLDERVTHFELQCSKGSKSSQIPPEKVNTFWYLAYSCWSRILESPDFWSTICSHIESLPGFSPEKFGRLRVHLPYFLAKIKGLQIERNIESGNRLSAARHRRFLELLVTDSELCAFYESAHMALENIQNWLWARVRVLKNDCYKRFEEIFNGLLLLYPKDLEVVKEALQAMHDTAIHEQTFDEEHNDAVEMCAQLSPYIDGLSQRVFPAYPDCTKINNSISEKEMRLLRDYHLLLHNSTASEERNQHALCLEALDKALSS